MADLYELNTDDLIKELLSRYDHAIFHGIKCTNDEASFYQSQWVGNTATCLGLAARIQHVINHKHFKESEDACPEDY